MSACLAASNRPSAWPCWGRGAPSASRRHRVFRRQLPTSSIAPTSTSVPATASGSVQFGVVGVETRSKAWSPSLDLFCCTPPTHVVGESQPAGAPQPAAQTGSSRGHRRPCWRTPRPWPSARNCCPSTCRMSERRPSPATPRARLAATNPAWAALASERAASQFGLHRLARHPGRPTTARGLPSSACRTLPPLPPSGNQDCTIPDRFGAQTGPVRRPAGAAEETASR